MTRACLLILALGCGCSTGAPTKMEAPPALTGGLLAQISAQDEVAQRADRPDAEEKFARRTQGEKKVRGTQEPWRPSPRPGGYGFDKNSNWNTNAEVARLLSAKHSLRAPVRLACVEVQGRREFVDVPTFGKRSISREDMTWSVRPAGDSTLDMTRQVFGLESGDPGDSAEDDEADAIRLHRGTPPFASVVSIPSLFLPGGPGDLGKVRYAAARVRADVILVFVRSTRVYAYNNKLANLYPLLFPAGFFLPAREYVAVSRAEGALIDVRTGDVYCVAQGETRLEETGSVILRNEEDSRRMIEEAESKVTQRMVLDLSRELAALEAAGKLEPKEHPKSSS